MKALLILEVIAQCRQVPCFVCSATSFIQQIAECASLIRGDGMNCIVSGSLRISIKASMSAVLIALRTRRFVVSKGE